MGRTLLMLLMVCATLPAYAASQSPAARITVDRTRGTADIDAVHARLPDVIRLASLKAGVIVDGPIPDRAVSISLKGVRIEELVERIAARAGLTVVRDGRHLSFVDPEERLVSLDVVQGEMQEIVASLARQCGIRNVMIDPGLDQRGTFRLEGVPCDTALRVVFESMGIGGELHPGSILVVRADR